jgi:cytosol alanyl aminopeptidase
VLGSFLSRLVTVLLLVVATACGDDTEQPPADTAGQANTLAPVATAEAPPIPPPPPPPIDEPIPLGQLSKTVMPASYRLALTIVPEKDRFEGEIEIDVKLAEPRSVIFLHGRSLTVTQVEAVLPDGRRIAGKYEQVDPSGVSKLSFPESLPAGTAVLDLTYYADFGRTLTGLYRVQSDPDFYAFTQFEPISARLAFPSFDEPAFKVPFDLQLIVRDQDKAVTNTPEVHSEPLGNGLTRHIFRTSKPLPTYLIAFAVGPLDIVDAAPIPASTLRQTPIPLRGMTVKGKGERIRYALERTSDITLILEEYFGTPYPYEKLDLVAAADFGAGAMENAGTIVYRETAILLDETASLQQKRGFALIHAHELAHQWFGDLVTPAWWDDIWLNEAFASWMGEKATAMWLPNAEYDRETLGDALTVMDLDALPSARSIRQPIQSNGDIYNAFDGITYNKGGGVLAMFESFLGEDAFREGVRVHMKRFAHGVATTRDFLESLAQGSGRPEVTAAFETFLIQPGVPLVSMKTVCDADPTHDLSQSAYVPLGRMAPSRLWQVPVCLRSLAPGSTARCELLDRASESIPVIGACETAVFPNAEGKSYYRFALEPNAWRTLTGDTALLTPGERLALLHSLRAGFLATAVETDLYLETLVRFARDEAWDVVEASLIFLTELHDTMLEGEARDALDSLLTQLLTPRYQALGLATKPGESAQDTLMRNKIVDFLVRTVDAQEVIDQLAPDGEVIIASGGQIRPSLAPELAETALWAAGQKGGAATGRAMIAAMLKSNDQQFRRYIVVALQSVNDPAFDVERNNLLLSQDIRTNEATRLIENLLENPDRRPGAWSWVKGNFDIYGKRLSDSGRGNIPYLARKSCDPALRADLAAFFEPKIAGLTGAPRKLSNALDAIDRCLALKSARGAEVGDWFKKKQAPGSN